MKKTWGISPQVQVDIPKKSLDQFCEEILAHV
jgi:hypothetical protein